MVQLRLEYIFLLVNDTADAIGNVLSFQYLSLAATHTIDKEMNGKNRYREITKRKLSS